MKKLPADFPLLAIMYRDTYFPKPQVDKVRDLILEVVRLLESGERNVERIQAELDRIIESTNQLQDDFIEHGSEIETVARESIADTIGEVLAYFDIPIETEEAIRARDW